MKNNQFTLGALGLFALGLLAASPLLRADGSIPSGSLLLLVLCVGPTTLWILRGMEGMPLYEMFAGMHLIYYWIPAGREVAQSGFSNEVNAEAIWVISLFLGASNFVHYSLMRWVKRRGGIRSRIMDLKVSTTDKAHWAWVMFLGAFAFEVLVQTGFIWRLVDWSVFRPVQTLFSAFAMLGTFGLAVHLGTGQMRKSLGGLFLLMLSLLVGLYVVSGFLGGAGSTALIAGFGYMLSSKRVPIITFLVCLAVGSLLNMGKREWRYQYWNIEQRTDIMDRATDFVSFSFKGLNERLSGQLQDEHLSATLLERASLIEILHRTITLTPRTIPYWGSRTYSYGLSLLVPKWLNPERGSIHEAMTEVGMTYGYYHSIDAGDSTNISIGPIAEAWISGGWFVVVLAGAAYGLFFSVGAAMAWGRPVESIGYLSGVFYFSQLVWLMEVFAGSLVMSFTRNYFIALMTLVTLALLQGLRRKRDRIAQGAAPRPDLAPTAR